MKLAEAVKLQAPTSVPPTCVRPHGLPLTETVNVGGMLVVVLDDVDVLELDDELLGAVVVVELAAVVVVVDDGAVVAAVLVELATVVVDGGAVVVAGVVVVEVGVVVDAGAVVVAAVVVAAAVVVDDEEAVVGIVVVFDGCVASPPHAPNTARTAIQVIRRRIGTILPLLIGTASPVRGNPGEIYSGAAEPCR